MVLSDAEDLGLFAGDRDGADLGEDVLGVGVALLVHSGKASVRPVVNAGTLGTGAPVVSTAEDTEVGDPYHGPSGPIEALLLKARGILLCAQVKAKRKNSSALAEKFSDKSMS